MSAQDGGPATTDLAPEHAPFARLKKRSEFLAAAKGARLHEAAFTLQAANRQAVGQDERGGSRRFGLTVTKKTGNSVVRNRIRRRLREALRLGAAARGETPDGAPRDYVIVARRDALACGFDQLARGIDRAIGKIDRRLAGTERR